MRREPGEYRSRNQAKNDDVYDKGKHSRTTLSWRSDGRQEAIVQRLQRAAK